MGERRGDLFDPAVDSPRSGATALILGLLGVTLCVLMAPVAWYYGGRTVQDVRAGRVESGQIGLAQAGRVLGMVGTGLLVVSVLYGVFAGW